MGLLALLVRDVAARVPAHLAQAPAVLLEWVRPGLRAAGEGRMGRPAVVLVHGILRGRSSMALLARDFRRSGFKTLNWGYPSTKARIGGHARALAAAVEEFLEPGRELILVGHSMGGLVARALLGIRPDLPLRKLIQVGTPNKGARKAALFRDFFLYRLTLGTLAGRELVPGPEGAAAGLPVPPPEKAHVVAGARGDGRGWSPLLPGDDDGTVELSSTALPGVPRETLPVLHAFLPWHREVRRRVLAAALEITVQ